MPSASELKRRLGEFLARHPDAQVIEEGEPLFDLRQCRHALEESRGRLLLHLWSEERNWIRSVGGIRDLGPGRMAIETERFGASADTPILLESPSALDSAERDRRALRRTYARTLRRLVQQNLPAGELSDFTSRADLKRSFSGVYARGLVREGNRWWAVMGAAEQESADGMLAFGLIWYDWNRRRYPERFWAGLCLFAPEGSHRNLAHRIRWLDPHQGDFLLFAVEDGEKTCTRVDVEDVGNLETRVVPVRKWAEGSERPGAVLERILSLAPGDIEMLTAADGEANLLMFRGLEFARARGAEVTFEAGGEQRIVTDKSFPELEGIVARLREVRAPGGSLTEPLYRRRAEAWLEHVVAAAPDRIAPLLRADWVYRQVLVAGGLEYGRADLLALGRAGRLAVVELKADEDIQLPLQGLDYWMRVAWHHERGEVAAAGYFPGIGLSPAAPELYLVAPALRFHPTAQTVISYLSPEVPVQLIGVNEDWRGDLKVVWRAAART